MPIEIISWSISTKVWDWAGIKLATPGSAVRLSSVARHVTDCATRPSQLLTTQDTGHTTDDGHPTITLTISQWLRWAKKQVRNFTINCHTCQLFFPFWSAIFIKVVLVILFLRYQSCHVKKIIDKENISTSNSLDFTQEIKNLHFFGSITYKNRGNPTKLWLQRLAEMDGKKHQMEGVRVVKIRYCRTITVWSNVHFFRKV